jgi:CRISPR-associated protein Cas5h
MFKDVLIFDWFGDYGHFRMFYTTTSPLTFPVPPRPTVCGLLGCILGIDRKHIWKEFAPERCKVAVQLINEVHKIKIKEVWRQGVGSARHRKDGWEVRFQGQAAGVSLITMEVLKNPHFRLYVTHLSQRVFEKLKEFIRTGKSVYQPYLGNSEFLANIEYINCVPYDLKKKDGIFDVHSIVPADKAELQLWREYRAFQEISEYPFDVLEDRQFPTKIPVYLDRKCSPLQVKTRQGILEYNDQNIIFLTV